VQTQFDAVALNTRRVTTSMGLLAMVFVAATLLAAPAARAQVVADCGGATLRIAGGHPSPFLLPAHAGGTLRVRPDTVLNVTGQGLPPAASVRVAVGGLGSLLGATYDIADGAVDIRVGEIAAFTSGVYPLEVTLQSAGARVCAQPMFIESVGGNAAVATASLVGAGVSGALAAMAAPFAAGGMHVKLKAEIERRGRAGWRRWLPVPAWRRMAASAALGIVAGVCATLLEQQENITPFSAARLLQGAATGGGISIGVSYGLGLVVTYLRPPKAGKPAAVSPRREREAAGR